MYEFLQEIVANNMTRPVKSVAPETTVGDLYRLFAADDFDAYPVVRDDRLVGVVSKLDAMKQTATALELDVTVGAEVPVGLVQLTFEGDGGKSAPLAFAIDRFTAVPEVGATDSARTAMPIKLPVTVVGVIDRAGDQMLDEVVENDGQHDERMIRQRRRCNHQSGAVVVHAQAEQERPPLARAGPHQPGDQPAGEERGHAEADCDTHQQRQEGGVGAVVQRLG